MNNDGFKEEFTHRAFNNFKTFASFKVTTSCFALPLPGLLTSTYKGVSIIHGSCIMIKPLALDLMSKYIYMMRRIK